MSRLLLPKVKSLITKPSKDPSNYIDSVFQKSKVHELNSATLEIQSTGIEFSYYNAKEQTAKI